MAAEWTQQQIKEWEAEFFKSGRDTKNKEFHLAEKTTTISGTSEQMKYIECTLKNSPATEESDIDKLFYYAEEAPKKQIVLHFTAGGLRGDIETLTNGEQHVSAPFVIARDGSILKLWDEKFWSYHLGLPAIHSNKLCSQQTIAIELSNVGPLRLKNNTKNLHCFEGAAFYCTTDDRELYTDLKEQGYKDAEGKPLFRKERYFATFTDAQYKSLITLLRYLTAAHGIDRTFLDKRARYDAVEYEKLLGRGGIVSHVNYRPSGKWDIGPAFDWDRVIKGVNKESTESGNSEDLFPPTGDGLFSSSADDEDLFSTTGDDLFSSSADDEDLFSSSTDDDGLFSS